MNQEKIGKFIAKIRKSKNMTQEQLAEKLGVNNRTISRWENGKTIPDISLFQPLCNELNITINELLNGEKGKNENIDENFIRYSNYLNKKSKIKIITLTIFIIIIIISFIITISLVTNKTFFKNVYNSEYLDNVNISIPKFTIYRSTGGMDIYTTKLKTLKQPDEINIYIDRYLNTFQKFKCNDSYYYYNYKSDFTIIQYRINNDGIGFINTIYITYSNGKYCE